MDELFQSTRRMKRSLRAPPGYGIRDARVADAGALSAVYQSILEEGRWFASFPDELPNTPAWQAGRIRLTQQDPTGASRILVAHYGDAVVGGLMLDGESGRRRRHSAQMEILLAPPHRGKGLGGALLDGAIAHIEAHPELSRLCLTVFEDNVAAIALYRSRGFRIEGRRVGSHKELDGRLRTDVLMAWVG